MKKETTQNEQSGYRLFEKLFDGPLDVVGDIHGELGALEDLMRRLGYSPDGVHPEGRHLIFVGDLVDRGPDSPEVLRKVRELVSAGVAQCVLGNHELNLLRADKKADNHWFMAPAEASEYPAKRMPENEKPAILAFLASLPVVLERDDLRVVHACWHEASIARLRELDGNGQSAAEIYDGYKATMVERLESEGVNERVRAEFKAVGINLQNRDTKPRFMPEYASAESRRQMDNPLAVVTSGVELPGNDPFWAGGKWRMVDRVKWWESYTDAKAVIFGHYWRQTPEATALLKLKFGPDLFNEVGTYDLMGPKKNLFCVDYSVAGRAKLRADGTDLNVCRLGAVRIPEWTVFFDDGAEEKLA